MSVSAHQRNSPRILSDAPVVLEDFRTGFNYAGRLYNYSTEGAYVESSYAPWPGRKIRIKIDGLPNASTPHNDLAEVRWRRPLPENQNAYIYGVGTKYC